MQRRDFERIRLKQAKEALLAALWPEAKRKALELAQDDWEAYRASRTSERDDEAEMRRLARVAKREAEARSRARKVTAAYYRRYRAKLPGECAESHKMRCERMLRMSRAERTRS